MRNLQCRFVLCSNGQIYSGDFVKFCGLLGIYELYSFITPVGPLRQHASFYFYFYLPNCLSDMSKWLFIISESCFPLDTDAESFEMSSNSETLALGDLLEVLETVTALPTQRDLDFEVVLDTVANSERGFL